MSKLIQSGLRLDAATELFAMQAEVRGAAAKMPERLKKADEDLMRIVRASAPDPSVFDTAKPIFIPSRISTQELDAYYTRMHESTLRNFARDAAEGRAFLEGHKSRELPLGYSLTGDVEGDAVYSYAFVVPGREVTDSFILAYKTGSVRDVSVGFSGGKHICSICENDIWDYEKCSHWPGRWYKTDEGQSNDESRNATEVLCYAWVHDAHLNEYSAVYDGATPGAVILKAQRQIEAGQMDVRTAQMLNLRYRGLNLELPTTRLIVPVKPLEERTMANENSNGNGNSASGPNDGRAAVQSAAEPTARLAEIRTALGVNEEADVVAAVRELNANAELGRRYRTEKIEAALAEGVRAKGDKFDRAAYETRFKAADIDEIEAMRSLWAEQADAVLPKGRQSQETAERGNEPEKETVPTAPLTPVGAFRA